MTNNTIPVARVNMAVRACSLRQSCKWIIALFFLILFPLTSMGASVTLDFRKLYTEEAREDMTPADLLGYLNCSLRACGHSKWSKSDILLTISVSRWLVFRNYLVIL